MEQDVSGGPAPELSRLQKETAVQTGVSHLKCVTNGITGPEIPAVPGKDVVALREMEAAIGGISRGSCGTLHLAIRSETYNISPEDGSILAVLGRKIPVYPAKERDHELTRPAGFACMGGNGSTVQFRMGNDTFQVTRHQYLALCLGGIVSVPLVKIVTDKDCNNFPGGV